ncbi:MAG TPA: wax ester/triacylglycerol synthase domain-containing protein [Mycobacterium sp.]|nr:wax ester/triacylglycerol synthase domain-containing protein [Mycobacterium sp.]HTY31102.1 wax ester/triacylglycerol synthase domain-containing protein [Mycobacterium sp.]
MIDISPGSSKGSFGPHAFAGRSINSIGSPTRIYRGRERDGMADTRLLDRLTSSDLFLLMWNDYGWSSDIGGLAILDGTSLSDRNGHVQVDAVRRHIEPRLHLVPRFRQLLYRPRRGLGWPLWVDTPAFDIADHIRVRALAAPADESHLLQACQELARRPFDPARPLWELWLLPGLPDQHLGAFLKIHHVVADGAAALAAFGALLDMTAEPPTTVAPPWMPTPIPTASELLRDNLRRRRRELGRGLSGLVHPAITLRRARRAMSAWREVLTERPAPRTSLNHPVGTERRLAIVRCRLDLAKQIGHAHHATVNDVVLAAVAGGLCELLASRGENVPLMQRAMVTIAHHDEDRQTLGNKPSWMMVPLPLGEADPVRRLEFVAAETSAAKNKGPPRGGQWDLQVRCRAVDLVPAVSAATVGEPGRKQCARSASAAVSRRCPAAGDVRDDAADGKLDACCRRAVVRRAAQSDCCR